jgi:hypothetical protein
VAKKVMLGRMISPFNPSARRRIIRPDVHEETAIACPAPVRPAMAVSSDRTVSPQVTMPDS